MGPVLIFDKSTLQALNADEAMWLDNFFLSNITPLFFIETLADLEKEMRTGRTPEEVVGNLALKTPDYSSKPNAHHASLLRGELLGIGKIDMDNGRPHISGGQTIELEGKTGVIFQPSPEEEALSRWQNHEFLDLERLRAKAWRNGLSGINLEENYKLFQIFFPIGKPKNLGDVRKLVDFQIDGPDQKKVLEFGLSLVGVSPQFQEEIMTRWDRDGKPSIRDFAPYFAHVFSVDLFFYLAISADLIGRGRPSHKVDLAYLYYLPFCMIFTSNDKLHAELVPHFLRENQTFIPGSVLKAELAKLDQHYSLLPDETKKLGVTSFAFYPPHDDSFLTTQLWNKYMSPTWKENQVMPKPQPNNPAAKKIGELIRRFEEEGKPVPEREQISSNDANHMIIRRMVRGTKGKWTRFPPEVMNRRKNKDGEWEDIPKVDEKG